MTPLEMFLALLIGHAVADYPLQGDFLARAKNFRNPVPGVPWYQAMAWHSLMHAGAVWLITGSVFLGMVELTLHFIIDLWKCDAEHNRLVRESPEFFKGGLHLRPAPSEKLFDIDQGLHVLCKLAYVALIWMAA